MSLVDSPVRSLPLSGALHLDAARETDRLSGSLKQMITQRLRRKGAVIGLSGGIDSSVCAALCVRALGPGRVLGLMMPEHDSAPESRELALLLAERLGIATIVEDIGPTLDAAGCYRRRDEAIRSVVPQFGAGCRSKLVLPPLAEGSNYRLSSIVVQFPDGESLKVRLPLEAYQQIVAATNFKQRVRKMIEYYHADRLRYAVIGTPNRLECDQGFFVKNGDGAADIKPIAHLYKTQVYQLAEHLGIPDEICSRPPTTDTFSLPQSQEEFYFSVPYQQMDLCLYGRNHDVPASCVAAETGLTPEDVERVYQDIDAKRRATAYLHTPPLSCAAVSEIHEESDE